MIVPVIHCTNNARSVHFYTTILDFEWIGTWPPSEEPAFTILKRGGHELHVSSHSGDGAPGTDIAVIVDGISDLFQKFKENGLVIPDKKDSPVHQGPVYQSWGTIEFYVDDPDGNTIRFIERLK